MSENSTDLSILLIEPSHEGLRNILSFFKKMPIRLEIVLLNPSELLARENPLLPQVRSLKEASLHLKGNFILLMDSNLKIPLAEVLSALAHFHTHPESQVLLGDRFTNRKKLSSLEPSLDRILRLWIQFLIKKLFVVESTDVFCRFKAFKNAVGVALLAQTSSLDLSAVEILLEAKRQNLNIQTLPVLWTEQTRPLTARLKLLPLFFKNSFELLGLRLRPNRSPKD